VERFVEVVIRRRWWVLLGCALVTAVACASLSQVVIATSFGRMFLGEDPGYDDYKRLNARFGSDQVLLLGVEDGELFTAAGRDRLRATRDSLREVKGVARVRSLLDAVLLEPGPLFPEPTPALDLAAAQPERKDEVIERLRADPLAGGLLLGHDGASTALLVELSPDAARRAEDVPILVREAVRRVEQVYPPERVHQAGLPALITEILAQTLNAFTRTTPLVAFTLLACVWVLFGRLWPAAVSLAVAAVAVVWSLGFAVALDPELHVLMAAVPGVILIIAFSDIVHLCSAYLLELEGGKAKLDAIRAAGAEVGRACVFTSLTTFVGFLCLSLIPVPAFRVLGVVLGFGVGVALLLAVTLVPILLSFLPTPKALRGGVAGRSQGHVDRLLDLCLRATTRRPWAVLAAFALVTVVAVAGATRLTIETDFTARLTEDNRVRRDGDWFAANFRGANSVQVYVTASDPAQLEEPAWWARLASFQRALGELDGVDGAGSLVDALSLLHRSTPAGAADPPGALPRDPQALRGGLALLRAGAGTDLRRLVDFDGGCVRLLVNVGSHGLRDTADVARRIEALAPSHLAPDDRVDATGLTALLGAFIDEVVKAQREGLGISIASIAILMAIGLASIRVGLVSMLPNLLPLAVLAACLGVFWDRVDSDAISLTFIALGIGVDDTIHFLSRFKLEAQRAGTGPEDRAGAIERTFAYAGRGIIMTTLILALGFLPFLTSDYFYMRMAGTLLPLCFVVALLADLLLIPALAQVGWMRFGPRGEGPLAAGSS
jgi:predicted RND superfamily exporter protein